MIKPTEKCLLEHVSKLKDINSRAYEIPYMFVEKRLVKNNPSTYLFLLIFNGGTYNVFYSLDKDEFSYGAGPNYIKITHFNKTEVFNILKKTALSRNIYPTCITCIHGNIYKLNSKCENIYEQKIDIDEIDTD